jgi:hypothetical protein
VRYTTPAARDRDGYRYQETVTSGCGGRYGATYAGGAVQPSGSASSGYTYSETSSGYGYAPVAGPS